MMDEEIKSKIEIPETEEKEAGNLAPKILVEKLNFFYGRTQALKDISVGIKENQVTAFIGPSGCGKSTFLRCLNRMNDLIPGTKVDGSLTYHGQDLYGPDVDPIEVRR